MPLLQICSIVTVAQTGTGKDAIPAHIDYFQSAKAYGEASGNLLNAANTGITPKSYGDIEYAPLISVKELRRCGYLKRVVIGLYKGTKPLGKQFSSTSVLVAKDKEQAFRDALANVPKLTYDANGALSNASALTLKYYPDNGRTDNFYLVWGEHDKRDKVFS
jgi:hypothetical protein